MSVLKLRFTQCICVCLLIFLGLLPACRQEAKTKTATAPVDTTVFDDDTLEGNSVPKSPQTERAR